MKEFLNNERDRCHFRHHCDCASNHSVFSCFEAKHASLALLLFFLGAIEANNAIRMRTELRTQKMINRKSTEIISRSMFHTNYIGGRVATRKTNSYINFTTSNLSNFAFAVPSDASPSTLPTRYCSTFIKTSKGRKISARYERGFAYGKHIQPNEQYSNHVSILTRMASSSSSNFKDRPTSYLNTNAGSGKGFGKNDGTTKEECQLTHVPLVFVPGMKGTHLAFANDDEKNGVCDNSSQSNKNQSAPKKRKKRKRAWLTLSHLLNFPPRSDFDPDRDLSLPLTYDYDPPLSSDITQDRNDYIFHSHYPRQHRGKLVPDGIVDHIIEFNFGSKYQDGEDDNDVSTLDDGRNKSKRGNEGRNSTLFGEARNFVDLNFLPFYGHTTRMLRDMDKEYHSRIHDGKLESSASFQRQDEGHDVTYNNRLNTTNTAIDNSIGENGPSGESKIVSQGIFDRIGSFVERTSSWTFSNTTRHQKQQNMSQSLKYCRPTAIFSYDWRRPLPELCTALHDFCESTFPNQPVQIVAHSLGGLMTFAAMREHPEKYTPGAVVVGVPFGTGIQYLQDLHKGYFTELDRCRQFTPGAQFTMSSHWGFFPISKKRLEDRFVDVSKDFTSVKGQVDNNGGESLTNYQFEADKSGIGKTGTEFRPDPIQGENAYFDFYDPDEWERLQLGVFGPEYDDKLSDEQREAYKEHMRIQMVAAKRWRKAILEEDENEDNMEANANGSSSVHSSQSLNRGRILQNFPPFVACATDKIPTVNQILRRRRQLPSSALLSPSLTKPLLPNSVTRKGRPAKNDWEYDYISGRSVPGDGRIDYDKAFPPDFISHKRVTLDSAHAKQMCWEESGGSWGAIFNEVVEQAEDYLKTLNKEQEIRQKSRKRVIEGTELTSTGMSTLHEAATPIQPDNVIGNDTVTRLLFEELKKERRRGRGLFVKNLVSRAKKIKNRIRRRKLKRRFASKSNINVAVTVRSRRFPFSRKKN